MTYRFVPNPVGIDLMMRSVGMMEALKTLADGIAAEIRLSGPKDADEDTHYVDMITVNTMVEGGIARGRITANKYTSWWLEAGTANTPAFAPVRKALEASGIRVGPTLGM